ncbi:MAG: hypothetical protein PGN09_07660 [Sphingomonas fennica]
MPSKAPTVALKRIRRIFRGLPDTARNEMVRLLDEGGRAMVGAIRARTPRLRGRLQAGIRYQVYRASLRLRVGLIGVRSNSRLFYGRILDRGRRAQTVTVSRRKIARSTLVNGRRDAHRPYQLRVRALPARRFVSGRYPDLKARIGNSLRGYWDRVLRQISGGANG